MQLSIITVNLNNSQGLQKTLESVRSQSFRDYEHLVIDGGSNDGSAALLRQWASRLSYACSEPDQGIFNAMNKGLAIAKGDYLLFLNAGDTLVEEETLQKLFAAKPTADVIYGNSQLVGNGVETPHIYPHPLTLPFLYVSSIGHQSSLIRRVVQLEHPYDESLRLVADWKFFLQCFLEGLQFTFVDQAIACFDATGVSNRPDLHGLQRAERHAVLHSLLGKSEMRRVAGQAALYHLPAGMKPFVRWSPALLRLCYSAGRTVRCLQSQHLIWKQRRLSR